MIDPSLPSNQENLVNHNYTTDSKVKILLCLNYDIYCNIALNKLLPFLIKNSNLGIIFSHKIGSKTNKLLDQLKSFESNCLKNQPNHQSFKQLISQNKITLFNTKDINSNQSQQIFKNHADLVISIRFGQIFKNNIIQIPKLGIINLHSGILPHYRGISPTLHAINNRQKHYGSTLHYIQKDTIDTGDIIKISKLKYNFSRSLFYNILQIYLHNTNDITNAVNSIIKSGSTNAHPQDHKLAKYFSTPSLNDIQNFIEKFGHLYEQRDASIDC